MVYNELKKSDLDNILNQTVNGRALLANWPMITVDDVKTLLLTKVIKTDFRIKNWKKFAQLKKRESFNKFMDYTQAITEGKELAVTGGPNEN